MEVGAQVGRGSCGSKPGRMEQKEEGAVQLLRAPSRRAPLISPLPRHEPTANGQPVPQARQWQSPEHLPHVAMAGSPGSQTSLVAREAWAGRLA